MELFYCAISRQQSSVSKDSSLFSLILLDSIYLSFVHLYRIGCFHDVTILLQLSWVRLTNLVVLSQSDCNLAWSIKKRSTTWSAPFIVLRLFPSGTTLTYQSNCFTNFCLICDKFLKTRKSNIVRLRYCKNCLSPLPLPLSVQIISWKSQGSRTHFHVFNVTIIVSLTVHDYLDPKQTSLFTVSAVVFKTIKRTLSWLDELRE